MMIVTLAFSAVLLLICIILALVGKEFMDLTDKVYQQSDRIRDLEVQLSLLERDKR